MNEQKTGEFLKRLRKEKGLTQEQLAEKFFVSSRTVSRWETGSNLPDVHTLIDLADFYDTDIREIIDGERKSENMTNETKDTLKKVAVYAAEETNRRNKRLRTTTAFSTCLMLICALLFRAENKGGFLYGIVAPEICELIVSFSIGFALSCLVIYFLHSAGKLDKFSLWKRNLFKKSH
ncbi:MAG: helix-turn-helix transcriptional regulator [Clostridia bacterium]|nr:helix-turn-helix transcriptional regulator [Clostridia bacterium]